jgi:hypothetical protein
VIEDHGVKGRKRFSITKITKTLGESLRMEYQVQRPDGTYRKAAAEYPPQNTRRRILDLPDGHAKSNYVESQRKTQARFHPRVSKKRGGPKLRVNLRSAYKLSTICCICGTTTTPRVSSKRGGSGTKSNRIQSHHVRHIHKGRVNNFSENILS